MAPTSGQSVVALPTPEVDVEATLTPDGPFAWFAVPDPVRGVLDVHVEGAPGSVRLELRSVGGR